MSRTAGVYRRGHCISDRSLSEIVLSRPVLEFLPREATESTLCHEMIHAWVDLVIRQAEGHGRYFRNRMIDINMSQDRFKVSVRHNYPLVSKTPRWLAVCPKCNRALPYRRKLKDAACRSCCNKHYSGCWNANCVLKFTRIH